MRVPLSSIIEVDVDDQCISNIHVLIGAAKMRFDEGEERQGGGARVLVRPPSPSDRASGGTRPSCNWKQKTDLHAVCASNGLHSARSRFDSAQVATLFATKFEVFSPALLSLPLEFRFADVLLFISFG
jgi:hypothetical protein